MLRKMWYSARALFFRQRVERELQAELDFHIERETEKHIREGLSPADATRRARIAFGSVEGVKEMHRDGRGTRWLRDFVGDTRLALRTLRRSPGVAVAVITTLALGIGANVAIFSAVHAVLLRPLPFANPERLVMLWEHNAARGWVQQTAAPANMLDWRDQVPAFADIGGYASFSENATLTGFGEPSVHEIVAVTGNFFHVLGVKALLGAEFRDEESWATGESSVMITYAMWRGRLGASDRMVGSRIQLDGRDYRVRGVLPANFSLPGVSADIFTTTSWEAAVRGSAFFRRAHWIRPVARLRDGVAPAQADAALQRVVSQLQRQYPETNTAMGAGMTPLQEFLVGERRRPLLLLMGAAALLLLIACANVANLLLVQAAANAQEAAVRTALGARFSRLVRQALTESAVLAILGAAMGCMLGWAATKYLGAIQPSGILPLEPVVLNGAVLAFVGAITVGSCLIFGIAPLLVNRRSQPADVLRGGTRMGAARAKRWHDALFVGEVATAMVLTLSASLLARSFAKLATVGPGVNTEGVLSLTISLPQARYEDAASTSAFWQQLALRARALPGVTSFGAVSALPLTQASWTSDFVARGWAADRIGSEVVHRDVLPGYFETLQVPLLRGRYIDDSDRLGSDPTVVINEVVSRQFFADENPVGQLIAFDRVPDSTSQWYRIVGVVGSERQAAMALPPRAEIFQPASQRARRQLSVVMRTNAEPLTLLPGLRALVAELDPKLALANVRTLDDVRAAAFARERFLTWLLFAFAAVGFALALVGVYGVMARVARGRLREMGIRLALGASPTAVCWLVVRRGAQLSLAGVAIGSAVSLLVSRGMQSLLYGIEAFDPVSFSAVPLVLAVSALTACLVPALSAGRANPTDVLRME